MILGRSDESARVAAPAVVLASLEALNAGEPEQALRYYADNAECRLTGLSFHQPDVILGKEQLRAWFWDLVTQHVRIEPSTLVEEGNVVTAEILIWSDLARQLGAAPLSATDRYSVRDGKIKSLGRTIHPESAAKLLTALSHTND